MDMYKVIIQAKLVREQYDMYCMHPGQRPLSVDDYLSCISQMENISFEKHTLDALGIDWKSKQIRGCLLRYADRAEIYVAPRKNPDDLANDGITFCEERFITIKEAAHISIDSNDSYIDHCLKLVNELLYPLTFLNQHTEAAQSEFIATIFAMELLFPFELRDAYKVRISDPNDPLKALDVAHEFKVPLNKLTMILSDEYHNPLCDIHKNLSLQTHK